MSNLRALRVKDVSPTIIMDSLTQHLPEMDQLYVVALMKTGEPLVWASGDLGELCHASFIMHDLALRYVRGEVDGET